MRRRAVGAALGAAQGLALAVAALHLAAPAAAEDDAALVADAVSAYTHALDERDRGQRLARFRRAERMFAKVAEHVRNADLEVNLGNAALQAERTGPAVLAYRRALRIDPTNARALQNLDHARSLLPEWVPRPEPAGLIDSLFFWHRRLAPGDRRLGAALSFAAAALLLAAGVRWRLPGLRGAAWLPGLVWLALVASLVLDPAARSRDEAVITATEVVARAADSALAPSALPQPLPGGAEVRILERRSPWLRVRLANGRDAWVAESSATPVWDGT
jgi:tetratricopeptide (TPR) repeat protein